MVKYEGEPSMRLGVALPKSAQKSKSTIFDKTNKTGHQKFSYLTKYKRYYFQTWCRAQQRVQLMLVRLCLS